jgi:trans-aconitate methyltransferase
MLRPYLRIDAHAMTLYNRQAEIDAAVTRKQGMCCKRARVVDLGCGQGHYTLALAKHYGTVYGVDPSLPMLTDARRHRRTTKRGASNHVTGQNVRFYKGSFDHIPVRNVHVIVMRNSLHFCTPANIPKTVDRILDHLVPGGLLIVNEPGDQAQYGSAALRNHPAELQRKRDIVARVRVAFQAYIAQRVAQGRLVCVRERVTDRRYRWVIRTVPFQ